MLDPMEHSLPANLLVSPSQAKEATNSTRLSAEKNLENQLSHNAIVDQDTHLFHKATIKDCMAT